MSPTRRYSPLYDATIDDYLAMLDRHGVSHGVLVQPSFLDTDNSYLQTALQNHPDRLRGIAVINPETDPGQLDGYNKAGFVGIRVNLIGLPDPDFSTPAWIRTLAKLRAINWQVEVHAEAGRLAKILPPLLEAKINTVVDHFGRPDPAKGIQDPGFQYLLSVANSRRVWVKISGAYRNGNNGAGEATALAAMPLLKSSFGLDRLIWGSDWPHTQFEKSESYDEVYSFLPKMLPDEHERHAVLVKTPAQLFRF